MAAFKTNTQIPIPIFSGENYEYWATKMRTYFMFQSLWDIVEKGYTTPNDKTDLTAAEEEKLNKDVEKDNLALYSIQMAMADSLFPRICGATTAKQAWDTLKEEFQGNVKVRNIKLQTLRRDLENMKMKESETVKDYYSRLREVINQLRAYGKDIPDKRVVEKILITLPAKYDPIVTTTEETKDITTLTITELVGSLEAYEKRLSMRQSESIENAFQSKLNVGSQNSKNGGRKFGGKFKNKGYKGSNREEKKGKYPPCGICKLTNHAEKDCYHQGKPQCFSCGRFGHFEKDYRSKQKQQANFT